MTIGQSTTKQIPVFEIEVGDKVSCFWGQWRVYATITRTTKHGVYAKRWNYKREYWTRERRIEPYKGMWRLISN